jgi:ABC-type nickel/cobalt efflux system permease component RcnA
MYFTRIGVFTLLIISFGSLAHAGESPGYQSFWTEVTVWLLEQQRNYHRELTTAMKSLSEDRSWASAEALILGSFFMVFFMQLGPVMAKL